MNSSVQANYNRIINMVDIELTPRLTPGARLIRSTNGWRMELPAGAPGTYRLAQMDDYTSRSRRAFRWSPPLTLRLWARLSALDLPGTWGFGLWNDPFGLSLGFGGTPGRLPVLPECAWFFHASPPNCLSLRDDLPAHGFLIGSFHARLSGSLPLVLSLPLLPFLLIRPASRRLRALASRIVQQEATGVSVDVTAWHEYSIQWLCEDLRFARDGQTLLHTRLSPASPLGLVLWIDNQYAAWTPRGVVRYGTLQNPACWLEITDLQVTS